MTRRQSGIGRSLRAHRMPTAIALAMVAALLLSACAVTGEDQARPISPSQNPSSPSSTTEAEPRSEATVIWMVSREALVRVLRRVPADPTKDELLIELLAGPTQVEATRGLRSALIAGDLEPGSIPEPTIVSPTATSMTGDATTTLQAEPQLAVVKIRDEFRARPLEQQILALGQSVLTLTSGGFDSVVFVDQDDQPVAVPGPEGRILEGSITAADYDSLRLRT